MPPWQSTADQGKACAITCWKALHTHTSFIHPTLSPHRLRRFRLLSRLWCGCCNNMHLRALEKLPFLSRLSGTKTDRPIAHPQPSHDHAELVGNVCILHWASKDIRASHEIWIPRDELSPSRPGGLLQICCITPARRQRQAASQQEYANSCTAGTVRGSLAGKNRN